MSLEDFRSVYLPYYLKKQKDGTYVVLNREHKPVGFNTQTFITYSDYPVSSRLMGIGAATAKKLSYDASENTDCIYLYNDRCVPTHSIENMNNYLNRLKILAKIGIKQNKAR